jgi:hypothetical protein
MPALHRVLRHKRDLPEIRGGALPFFSPPVRSYQVLLFIKKIKNKKLDQPRVDGIVRIGTQI